MLKRLATVTLLSLVLFLLWDWSLKGDSYKNGHTGISPDLDRFITDQLLAQYADAYAENDQVFEAHKIYGSRHSDSTIQVYLWSVMEGFTKEGETESQMGHSIPVVLTFKQKTDGTYQFVRYQEPEDGEGWSRSVSSLFPRRYQSQVMNDAGNADELSDAISQQAKAWHKEIKANE